MARKHYAMSTPYGATTASKGDALVRFDSRAEREAWVAEAYTAVDYCDRAKRDAVTREQARRWYPEAFRAGAGSFPPARTTDAYWDDPDDDGAEQWLGAPTGGVYATI